MTFLCAKMKVEILREKSNFHHMSCRSPQNLKSGHFVPLFHRERERNQTKRRAHAQGHAERAEIIVLG